MRRFTSLWLAGASALLLTTPTDASRPRYGGVLRVETAAALRSFDPAAPPVDAGDALARRWLHPLVFETLIALDATRGLVPQIALQWSSNADHTRWELQIRSGIKLHDGTPLDASRIAAALRGADRSWRVSGTSGVVTIETDVSSPRLPWALAASNCAIAFSRPGGGEPIGSGPFAIDRWEPRRLRLRPHEDHWAGRPFLDAVDIEMGRAVQNQLNSLGAGAADLVSLEAIDAQRAVQRGFRIAASGPLELVVLVFRSASVSERTRRALALAIDRRSMSDVLMHGRGAPAFTVLPQWLSGYATLAPASYDRAAARALAARDAAPRRGLTIDGDSDPLLRAVLDRVIVDAADAGITIARPVRGGPAAEARVLRIKLEPTTPSVAFTQAVNAFGFGAGSSGVAPAGDALETVYASEVALRETNVVIPLLHLAELYASTPRLQSWREPLVLPSGRWNLASAWLREGRP